MTKERLKDLAAGPPSLPPSRILSSTVMAEDDAASPHFWLMKSQLFDPSKENINQQNKCCSAAITSQIFGIIQA